MEPAASHSAFRPVPKTGVIFVMGEAANLGYRPQDPKWANLGQGQPDTGPLPQGPDRIGQVTLDLDDNEYAPVNGLIELRDRVAQMYNGQYRRGLKSQYSAENVVICGGGRLALTRAAASLGRINLGHFLPDYTAYEELLDVFHSFNPIPILLDPSNAYHFSHDDFRREALGRGMSAVLLSNPSNPTGRLLHGKALAQWVDVARELDCCLLMDEFYSHYIWDVPPNRPDHTVSSAAFVENTERDPVVIFNGLTKNWRYPGWRLSWVLGPKQVCDAITSAGSFLDGGGSRPLQRAALPLLTPEHVRQETEAIHHDFSKKRDMMLRALEGMGIRVELHPQGTFYIWGSTDQLAEPLRDGMDFFHRALQHQVITVPGEFFDVNPGGRRHGRRGRFNQHVRFSFGPPMAVLEQGLMHLRTMIDGAG